MNLHLHLAFMFRSASPARSSRSGSRSRSPSADGEKSQSPAANIQSPSSGAGSPRKTAASPNEFGQSPSRSRSASPASQDSRHSSPVRKGVRSPNNDDDSHLSREKDNIASPRGSESNSRLSAHDAEGPSSPQSPERLQDQGPASPQDQGPSSPQSPQDEGPASPQDQGPLSPQSAGGPASPEDQGPASPQSPGGQQDHGPSSPQGSDVEDQQDKGAQSPANVTYSPAASPKSDVDSDADSDIGAARKKKVRRASGDSDNEEKLASDTEMQALGSGAEDSDDESPKKTKKRIKSGDDASDKGSEVGELIANIFGSSDEEEEFEGFGAAEVEGAGTAAHTEEKKGDESSDEERVDGDSRKREGFVSDFDLMMERKKEQNKKRRRRKDVDIINDNDDLVVEMIRKMREVAEDDRQFNQQRKPAVGKLKMLPTVIMELKKADLQVVLIENGILNAITDWLAPLPDKSLPHLKIRESLLKQLSEFPPIGAEALKASGIGKAVMYLYKHPKEERHNKDVAGKLINEWSRPIFNVTANHKSMSREEREQRDYEHLPKKRRLSLETSGSKDMDRALAGGDAASGPGAKGFIGRARVPQPSTKDYVVRPKWNVEEKVKGSGKKAMNRFEKTMLSMKSKQKDKSSGRAISISISGNKMAL